VFTSLRRHLGDSEAPTQILTVRERQILGRTESPHDQRALPASRRFRPARRPADRRAAAATRREAIEPCLAPSAVPWWSTGPPRGSDARAPAAGVPNGGP